MSGSSHEDFGHREVKVGSEKSFGLVFAGFFALVGLWRVVFHGEEPRWWALAVAVVFLALAYGRPSVLRPLNLVWFKFGMLLSKIMTPLVMGLLFFSTVVPTGLIMRMLGKDPMRLKRDPDAASYWIPRVPPGPEPETMKNQF